ncbi:hypothetical protein JTE90_025508 [Oedothorax gibbosus]|uniref:Uncharacterized protein n=1 Tax=Oedothorax gibbosus TaxID=931172 RepID=A0AAV6TUB0_9ARAC|nr:hypothetical protein JTE90_025508 [Oedothorax gibbosus]
MSQLSEVISISTNRWWNKNQDIPLTSMKTKEMRRLPMFKSAAVDSQERLREQIARIAAENFDLRESNVKLHRLSKLQDAKKRDLAHKISLQEQQREKMKSDKRMIAQLQGTLSERRLQVKELEAQIELAKVMLAEEENAVLKFKKRPVKTPEAGSQSECYRTTRASKSAESYNSSRTELWKSSRGARRYYKTPSLKIDYEMNYLLSRLNGLLDEVNANNIHVAGCEKCKRDLGNAQSRIESLLAQAKGVAENDMKKKDTPSMIYEKSDTVEILSEGVQKAMGDL